MESFENDPVSESMSGKELLIVIMVLWLPTLRPASPLSPLLYFLAESFMPGSSNLSFSPARVTSPDPERLNSCQCPLLSYNPELMYCGTGDGPRPQSLD